jgi:hypothetical protein
MGEINHDNAPLRLFLESGLVSAPVETPPSIHHQSICLLISYHLGSSISEDLGSDSIVFDIRQLWLSRTVSSVMCTPTDSSL